MSRIVSCLMMVAVVATATGCNCFGNSCRRPSFMEFRSPCSSGYCETMPACGPACGPVGMECSDCGTETIVVE